MVTIVLTILVCLPVVSLLVLCGMLWLQCIAALVAPMGSWSLPETLPSLAVLVPAHNEALGIRRTLEQLILQVDNPRAIIVVADNCTDETAQIARALGVTVLERCNEHDRGKGFALDFGLHHLSLDPPDIVVLIDADCDIQPGTIAHIAHQAAQSRRPIQALYLMAKPHHPQPKDEISAFAFKVKNLVRPLGMRQWGQPCLLTGTGMAFPWDTISQVNLASGEIVEDMKLGLDLALAGAAPEFCPAGVVWGRLPSAEAGVTSQRTRWEHGHLHIIRRYVPHILVAGVRQLRLDLLAIALELAIPPLSLLVMLWLGTTLGVGLLTKFGWITFFPLLGCAIAGLLLLTSILSSWVKFGRKDLPAQTLLNIPFYILWKIPLYLNFLRKPQVQWVRTQRDEEAD